jgi:hypothetical protein
VQSAQRLRRCGLVGAGAALVLAVGAPGAAGADPKLPGASPAIMQYIEMIPTANGSEAVGTGQGKAAIPAVTREKIERTPGSEAELLEKVVSSEAYGAPERFSPLPKSAGGVVEPNGVDPTRSRAGSRVTVPSPPSAASAALGTFGVHGLVLILALGAALGVGLLPRLSRA